MSEWRFLGLERAWKIEGDEVVVVCAGNFWDMI